MAFCTQGNTIVHDPPKVTVTALCEDVMRIKVNGAVAIDTLTITVPDYGTP